VSYEFSYTVGDVDKSFSHAESRPRPGQVSTFVKIGNFINGKSLELAESYVQKVVAVAVAGEVCKNPKQNERQQQRVSPAVG
jgi:hypothetical protein